MRIRDWLLIGTLMFVLPQDSGAMDAPGSASVDVTASADDDGGLTAMMASMMVDDAGARQGGAEEGDFLEALQGSDAEEQRQAEQRERELMAQHDIDAGKQEPAPVDFAALKKAMISYRSARWQAERGTSLTANSPAASCRNEFDDLAALSLSGGDRSGDGAGVHAGQQPEPVEELPAVDGQELSRAVYDFYVAWKRATFGDAAEKQAVTEKFNAVVDVLGPLAPQEEQDGLRRAILAYLNKQTGYDPIKRKTLSPYETLNVVLSRDFLFDQAAAASLCKALASAELGIRPKINARARATAGGNAGINESGSAAKDRVNGQDGSSVDIRPQPEPVSVGGYASIPVLQAGMVDESRVVGRATSLCSPPLPEDDDEVVIGDGSDDDEADKGSMVGDAENHPAGEDVSSGMNGAGGDGQVADVDQSRGVNAQLLAIELPADGQEDHGGDTQVPAVSTHFTELVVPSSDASTPHAALLLVAADPGQGGEGSGLVVSSLSLQSRSNGAVPSSLGTVGCSDNTSSACVGSDSTNGSPAGDSTASQVSGSAHTGEQVDEQQDAQAAARFAVLKEVLEQGITAAKALLQEWSREGVRASEGENSFTGLVSAIAQVLGVMECEGLVGLVDGLSERLLQADTGASETEVAGAGKEAAIEDFIAALQGPGIAASDAEARLIAKYVGELFEGLELGSLDLSDSPPGSDAAAVGGSGQQQEQLRSSPLGGGLPRVVSSTYTVVLLGVAGGGGYSNQAGAVASRGAGAHQQSHGDACGVTQEDFGTMFATVLIEQAVTQALTALFPDDKTRQRFKREQLETIATTYFAHIDADTHLTSIDRVYATLGAQGFDRLTALGFMRDLCQKYMECHPGTTVTLPVATEPEGVYSQPVHLVQATGGGSRQGPTGASMSQGGGGAPGGGRTSVQQPDGQRNGRRSRWGFCCGKRR